MPLFLCMSVKQNHHYGLIGYPLTHSFSPAFFAEKFEKEGIEASYSLFPISSINELPALLANDSCLRGLNVTIPYKQAVLPYLHTIDTAAVHTGAVNCIDIRNGIVTGYNTDIIGFRQSLQPLLQPQHTHALILGTGGASLAVKYVLDKLGIVYQSVSRTKSEHTRAYEDLAEETVAGHTLIINTTPAGMYPDVDSCPPLPYHAISSQHLLYDLVYNPEETLFLAKGKTQGATVKNGLEMLQLQAEASWDIWNR